VSKARGAHLHPAEKKHEQAQQAAANAQTSA
jgi:hypothetical protein